MRKTATPTIKHICTITCKNGKEYDIFKKGNEFGFYSQSKSTPGEFMKDKSLEKVIAYVSENNGGLKDNKISLPDCK